jgi:hypothetical protein
MLSRRKALTRLAAGAAGSALLRTVPTFAAGQTPNITGPITGGRREYPFAAYADDLGALGYVEEEFFIEGEATRYRPVRELTPDGKWAVEPNGTEPYKTRLLVRRPQDPSKFNGAVVMESINVSVGWELTTLGTISRDIYRDGFVFVTASCQRIGLEGYAKGSQGLKVWDPERYGSLSIPGDSISFDIFSQAGRAVGPNRSQSGVDPLGGLNVRQVIASGASQSAARLRTYINAIHPRDRVFDAFMPTIDFGRGAGFDDRVLDPTLPSSAGPAAMMANATRIRDDLDAPVVVVNSETETLLYLTTRQPDSNHFRLWEVAGASHAPAPNGRYLHRLRLRDGLAGDGPIVGSEVAWHPTADAALFAINRWIGGGSPPSTQARIEVTSESPPKVVRDQYGNARGGVRLPEVEVPIAHNEGAVTMPGVGSLNGTSEPLPADVLKQLYPTPDVYVSRVTAAAQAALEAGVIRPGRVEEYIEAARAARM